MNKLFALLVGLIALLAFFVDSSPLSRIPEESTVRIVRREVGPNHNSTSPQGNSSSLCNSTDCDNSTTNVTSNFNLTSSLNVTATLLNLTRVCSENTTGITLQCNGTTLNLTKHCEDTKNGSISSYCVNGTLINKNVSLSSNVTLFNATIITANRTLSNSRWNATAANATSVNETMNGTVVGLAASIFPSQTTSLSTSTLSVSPSLSATALTSSASMQVHPQSSSIQPSRTSSMAAIPSSSVAATAADITTQLTMPTSATPQSTTSKTTTQPTTGSTTAQPTTPKATTEGAEITNPKTEEATTTVAKTDEVTTAKKETEHIIPGSTSGTDETDKSTAATTMESPYNSAKNVKFFYVNVLIPVGAGVCGALLIAFSVILFKCCRRRKLKKVRYFGKPRKGYTRSNMDHMNLLAVSSDEE